MFASRTVQAYFLSMTIMLGCMAGMCEPMGETNTRVFRATLSGGSEVPPVETEGTGTSVLTLDEDNMILVYTISWEGLSGDVTAAHFHNGPVGEDGGVVENISDKFADDQDGFVQGAWSLSAAELAELIAGNIYINLHTEQEPDGEIRGQYIEDTE